MHIFIKDFSFDNYIEFGKYLEELLYNFSYNYIEAKSLFENKNYYKTEITPISKMSHYYLATGKYTLEDIFGNQIYNYPNRKLSTNILLKREDKKINVFLELRVDAYTVFTQKVAEPVSKTQIYRMHKQGADTDTYMISIVMAQIFDRSDNSFRFRMNKYDLTEETLRGFGIKYARTVFLI